MGRRPPRFPQPSHCRPPAVAPDPRASVAHCMSSIYVVQFPPSGRGQHACGRDGRLTPLEPSTLANPVQVCTVPYVARTDAAAAARGTGGCATLPFGDAKDGEGRGPAKAARVGTQRPHVSHGGREQTDMGGWWWHMSISTCQCIDISVWHRSKRRIPVDLGRRSQSLNSPCNIRSRYSIMLAQCPPHHGINA